MKNLALFGLIFLPINIFSQEISEEDCEKYTKQIGLKYLQCIYHFDKKDSKKHVYQIYQWSAFGRSMITNIEKRKSDYFLISYEISQPIYNEKTDEWNYPRALCQDRKLEKNEYNALESIISQNKFMEIKKYELDPICSDGSGIIFQALVKGEYRNYSNGNCAGKEEYLNKLYKEIKEVLKF